MFNLQLLADKLEKQGGELCLSHAFQYITKSQPPGDERHFSIVCSSSFSISDRGACPDLGEHSERVLRAYPRPPPCRAQVAA